MPTPTTPRVFPSRSNERILERLTSTELIYCLTDQELHPGAFRQMIPCSSHQPVSIWSKPIVAVAITLTEDPFSRDSSQMVLVRVMMASASLTTSGVVSLPGRYTTSA